MPSGITKTDELFYTGEMPWHKNGVKLDNPATSEEAIEAANLGWRVIPRKVYLQNPVFNDLGRFDHSEYSEIQGKRAIVRADTNETFNVMGEGYEPLQNSDAFRFFDSVIAQGEAVYHTAGSLFGGRKIFILAKLPADIEIIKGDPVQPYILLSNSHDGSQALRMQITPIRVVCWNTLSSAIGRNYRSKQGFYARHTRGILNKTTDARNILELTHAYFEMYASTIDRLVNTRMSEDATDAYIKQVLDIPADIIDIAGSRAIDGLHHTKIAAYTGIAEALTHPTNTVGGMQGTAWAALNAVTYYIDHTRNMRIDTRGKTIHEETDAKANNRLNSSWFGKGAAMRQKAYDLLEV